MEATPETQKEETASKTTVTTSTTSTKSGKSSFEVNGELISKQILDFSESKDCPNQIRPILKKIAPIVVKVFIAIDKLIPILEKIYNKALEIWAQLQPYKPDLLLPSFVGLIMCFFGGSYLTLIAAVEAFNLTSSGVIIESAKILYEDFQKIAAANEKDNAKDEDGDGVADVLQVNAKELLRRKTVIFLKTMDPNRLMTAVAALNAGFMAIIATLKLEFAKTITLGNSIYNTLEPPLKRYVLPKFELLFPVEYRKWAYPILSSVLRSFVISWAWFLQRIISAFHSAMKGGLMFSRNLLEYLSKMNIIHINHEDTYLDEIIGGVLALLGLWFQLSFRFALPFPLNILLFPFSLAEWFLMWMVNTR